MIAELGKNKIQLGGELVEARGALLKSHNEAFTALESGYNLCWDRAVKAGYDMGPHSFAHHCEEVARAREGGGDSDRREGSVA